MARRIVAVLAVVALMAIPIAALAGINDGHVATWNFDNCDAIDSNWSMTEVTP